MTAKIDSHSRSKTSNVTSSQQVQRCLGPVADLERHLPTEWWKTLFNSLYLKTDADVVENTQNTRADVDLIIALTHIEPNDSILDICCGQGRHCFELASRGYRHVQGIDRSRYLVRLARKRTVEQGYSSIRFSEGDARRLRIQSDTFDCVIIMGNSFGYFEKEQEDLQVLKEACRVLRHKGTLLLDVTDGRWMHRNFSPRTWEWIDQQSLVCRERNLGADGKRLISREVVIQAEQGVIADQFYAERLYTVEELQQLLEEAGFQNIEHKSNVNARSDRNDGDLGMMAHRIILTATAPDKMIVPIQSRKTNVLECAVLLGDPSLPDKVKRDGKFNQEDIVVIDRLKEALGKVSGYKFSYLDNHAKLIENLKRHPPQFVFNLCDEGFRNEAILEAHVPAYLDMLGIPYTGAGIGCLTMCYDKSLVHNTAYSLEIPVPREIWIDPGNQSSAIPADFPAFVKPACGDSSIGITQHAVVDNAEQLVDYFDWLSAEFPGIPVLVQEFLSGREFSVGLVGNSDDLYALPILEVDYTGLPNDLPKILGYESKWLPDSPYWSLLRYQEADLTEEVARFLVDMSTLLFSRLGCRDYARFDFRESKDGCIKLLEVNPNPGWCWDGKFNMMSEWAGWSYSDMLARILDAAKLRLGLV